MLRGLENAFYMRKLQQSGEMSPSEVEEVLEDEEFDVSCLRNSKLGEDSVKRYEYSPKKFIGDAEKKGQSIQYSRFKGPYDTVHYLEILEKDGKDMQLKLRKFNISI